MASNWQVEARGLMYWSESFRKINFEGNTYNITFVELNPERYEKDLVKEIDDHTVELTVEDPNNLVT
jgi:hypothetical protein